MRRLIPAVVVAAALLAPSPAGAGSPVTLGAANSSVPTVTAGGNGLFHVVYNDRQSFLFKYCQVRLPSVDCAKSALIPFNDNPPTGDQTSGVGSPGSAWVVTDPDGGPLRLIIPQYISGNTYESVSTDEGTTWSAPRLVHTGHNSIGEGRPILQPDRNTVLVPRANLDGPVLHDTSSAASDVRAQLDGGGQNPSYNPAVANVHNGTITTGDDLDDAYAWFAPAGSPLIDAPSWGTAALVGPVSAGKESMAGGGGSAFIATTTGSPKYSLQIRKWGGLAFGKPTTIIRGDNPGPDLSVTESGTPGVVYDERGGRLGLAAPNGKGVYETKPILKTTQVYHDLDSAYDDSGQGLVVWAGGGSPSSFIGAADMTEVADPSAAGVTVTVSKHRKTVGLTVTGSCVKPGAKLRVFVSGQGYGTVKKVVFGFAGKQVSDKEPPKFGASFTVPKSADAGDRLAVTAAVPVQRKTAPKKFTIKINNSVDVCGG